VSDSPESLSRRSTRGVAWVAAGSWLQRILLLAVVAVLAVELNPGEFGVLTVASIISTILVSFNDLGFSAALVYQQDRVRESAQTTIFIALAAGSVFGIALFVTAPIIASFFHAPAATPIIRAYSVVVVLNAAATPYRDLLTRELNFRRRLIPDSWPYVAGAITTIACAIVGAGVWSLVAGDALAAALALVFVLLIQSDRIGPRWHRSVARELWRFARSAVMTALLDVGLQNVDYLLVGRLLGPTELGLYSFAFKLAIVPLWTVAVVVGGVTFPTTVKLLPNLDRVRSLFRSSLRLGCAASFWLGCGLLALAPFVELLGDQWRPAILTARLLGIYVCFRCAAQFVTPVIQGVGRPFFNVCLKLVWLVALTALIIANHHRGISGVAAAQVVVAGAMMLAHAAVARRLFGATIGHFLRDVGPAGIAGALAALVCIVANATTRFAFDPSSYMWFAVYAFVYTAVYAATAGMLSRALRQDIRDARFHLLGRE
jgi:O-antigen/teichoic acid export membrane protein